MPQNVVKTPKTSPSKHASGHCQSAPSRTNSESERPKSVAIVGSRHNTSYGEEVAYRLAYELAKRGVVVISGLAYGIDSIAHRGCLAAGGTTVAVLGNSFDYIHPTAHTGLAAEICQRGAIISEYAPRTPDHAAAPLAPGEFINDKGQRQVDHKSSFLHRNRLISGLADIVVVVEAAERSGSLNTAAHALDQGRTVYAVPGNINAPYSQGCNKLITQGAVPYTEPADILRELFLEQYVKHLRRRAKLHLIGNNDVETKILQALYAGAHTLSEIATLTHLPPEVMNESLTILELGSRIRALAGGGWSLAT